MKTGILGMGVFLPERVMTNEEWAEHVDTSDEWITTRTGIKTRRIVSQDESTADLATAAAEDALKDAGLTPDDVGEIIVATDTPETYSPDTASFVQERLGAGPVPAYDLGGSGCAGWVMGMDIARSRAVDDKKVLVIGVEVITKLMDWTQRETAVLFGDAAAASIIGSGPEAAEILAVTAGTDGTQTDILGMPLGGAREFFNASHLETNAHRRIVMNGREVFKNAVRRMSDASKEVMAQVGITTDDVSLVIPHQANLRIIDAVQKALDLPDEKLYVNVQDYGNTGSASVPLALWEARQKGLINEGDLVVLAAFGAGFHWAAAVVRF